MQEFDDDTDSQLSETMSYEHEGEELIPSVDKLLMMPFYTSYQELPRIELLRLKITVKHMN